VNATYFLPACLAFFLLLALLQRSKVKNHVIKKDKVSKKPDVLNKPSQRYISRSNSKVHKEYVDQGFSAIETLHYDSRFVIQGFQIQKEGLSYSECEDRASICYQESSMLRVAVSDGATESLFSGLWAETLTESYLEHGRQAVELDNIITISKVFTEKSVKQIQGMPESRQWLMYEKLERGASATFLGLEMSDPSILQVIAVGDSCLFWKNTSNDHIQIFPDLKSDDFDSYPNSICHLPETWKLLKNQVVRKNIPFEVGSQGLLCTDAFAAWLITALAEDRSVWDRVFQLSNFDDFSRLVHDLRIDGKLKNDDVTLVTINDISLHV
jgi:hypothetical protein